MASPNPPKPSQAKPSRNHLIWLLFCQFTYSHFLTVNRLRAAAALLDGWVLRRHQIAFGLFLPGAEMMRAASLHSIHENERQMLFEHLDLLHSDDLLLLDRGYPCR